MRFYEIQECKLFDCCIAKHFNFKILVFTNTREGSRIEVSKIILIWNGNSIPSDFLLVNLDFPAKKRRQNSNLLIRNPMEWNFHPR